MIDKLAKRLNYLIGQVSGKTKSIVRDVKKDIERECSFWEEELSGAQEEIMYLRRQRETYRMLAGMAGVPINDTIQDDTIRFLYYNMEEIKEKNPDDSLLTILFKVQQLLDYTSTWAEICGIDKKVFSLKDLNTLKKEINAKYKEINKEHRRKIKQD